MPVETPSVRTTRGSLLAVAAAGVGATACCSSLTDPETVDACDFEVAGRCLY